MATQYREALHDVREGQAVKLRWYWFPLRRPLSVTFHLDRPRIATWRGIYGIGFRWRKRELFVGLVSSGNSDAGKA